jgi:xanthine dehydrogenase YagS FAD-binding subunit
VKAFAYVNAANQQEALAALGTANRGRRLPLAGGMDLIGLMKDYVVSPDVLVNVKKLPSTIAVPAQGLTVLGAAATLADLAEHVALGRAYPALTEAAAGVGTPQIRNLGTVGGNLMQRPAVLVLPQRGVHCLKKGGARCFAVGRREPVPRDLRRGPLHIVHPSSWRCRSSRTTRASRWPVRKASVRSRRTSSS